MQSLSHPSRIRIAPIPCLACAIATFLFGCQSMDTGSLTTSVAPPEISGPAAGAIAGDLVSRLVEQVEQGKATIVLKQDGSPFGQALEAALKGWGYNVVTERKTDRSAAAIPLTYMIASFDGQVLARLSSSSVELGRAYTVTTSGATPASAISLMRRG